MRFTVYLHFPYGFELHALQRVVNRQRRPEMLPKKHGNDGGLLVPDVICECGGSARHGEVQIGEASNLRQSKRRNGKNSANGARPEQGFARRLEPPEK